MTMTLPWHLYLMAAIYFFAGLNHFRKRGLYERIIPPYLPWPVQLNYAAGAAEVVLAVLLCLPAYTHWAAWGIMALLIAVFPANLFMFQDKKASLRVPKWLLFIRLPFQIVLLIWAYCYTS